MMSTGNDAANKNLHEQQLTPEQIEGNIKTLERLWEYRYVRLVDYAFKTNNWFKLFSFVA